MKIFAVAVPWFHPGPGRSQFGAVLLILEANNPAHAHAIANVAARAKKPTALGFQRGDPVVKEVTPDLFDPAE